MSEQLGEIQVSERGFEYVEFRDTYGLPCSLQQSSAALCETPGAGAVWLGTGTNRMHLDSALVEKLVVALNNWLKSGKFEERQ